MTVYMPVLQAREGELTALGNLDPAVVPLVQPMLEAVCYRTGESLWATALRLAELAGREVLEGTVAAIDCVHLDRHYGADGQGGPMPMEVVAEALENMLIPIRPVVRITPTATPSSRVWRAAGEIADLHGQGACVRMVVRGGGGGDAFPALAEQVSAAADRLGCGYQQLDLLVDLGPVTDRGQVPHAVAAASKTLTALGQLPWRQIAVASASFPDSISSVPLGGYVPFPRLDADIWRQLTSSEQAWAGRLSFGDYGVVGTRMPRPGAVPRPKPNLRYADRLCWHTYRYPKDQAGGFSTFYELCRQVTSKLWWAGKAYSWGDAQIALRANGRGGTAGPARWRAFSLSHHIAVAVDELRRHAR